MSATKSSGGGGGSVTPSSVFEASEFPVRISVMTYNVWGAHHWPARAPSLRQVFQSSHTDVVLLQEVTPDIIRCLDETLITHERVKDKRRPGWQTESQIYWNKTLFSLVDFGFGELGIPDNPNRGLFWVRLSVKSNPKITFFASTVHFPWCGCETEVG